MIFPFRHSSIFRNRWIALAWAAGICFMASEVVDSLSSVTTPNRPPAASTAASSDDPVAVALRNAPPPDVNGAPTPPELGPEILK